METTTKNLLSLLKNKKIIRLKKNTTRTTKSLDKVFLDFKELAKNNKDLRVLESFDEFYEMIILYDINYRIDSFLI